MGFIRLRRPGPAMLVAALVTLASLASKPSLAEMAEFVLDP